MVVAIAEDIGVEDLSKLRYISEVEPKGKDKEDTSVLNCLKKLIEKGKFSHYNVEPLEDLLKDIQRCDLLTKHTEPYKQKYGEVVRRKGQQKSMTRPFSFPALHRKPSFSGTKLRSSTDPCQTHHATVNVQESCFYTTSTGATGGNWPQPCVTVPEEETAVGGSSPEPHMLMHKSVSGHVNGTPTVTHSVQPRYYRSPLRMSRQRSFSLSPSPTPTCTRQQRIDRSPSAQSMGDSTEEGQLPGRMRMGSSSSVESAVSTPRHKPWQVPCNDSTPPNYCGTSTANSVQAADEDTFYVFPFPQQFPYNRRDHVPPWTNPAHCSLPTLLPHTPTTPHAATAARYMSVQDMHRGSSGGCTTPDRGARVHTKSHEWTITRKSLVNGMNKLGKPLNDRVSFRVPVGCQVGKNPKVSLSIIPCQIPTSRHVAVVGEMVIPRTCSRHKWLVSYCHCSLHVTVSVVDHRTHEIVGRNSSELDLVRSEFDSDHTTCINLNNVLDHQKFLYEDRAEKFIFQAKVELFVNYCREDNVDVVITESKVCGDDFLEVSLPA